MSHFTKCATNVSDVDILRKALNKLGWTYEEGDFTITQYGTSSKAQIKFSDAVGLALQEDGTFAMVGDPYHDRGQLRKYYGQEKKFAADLQKAYALEKVRLDMELQQFFCTENTEAKVGEDGKIRMVFTRY